MKMRFRSIILCTLLFFISSAITAQEKDFSFYHKIENNQLFVRWVPNNIEAFQHAINGNMTMELHSVEGSVLRPEFRLLNTQEMMPLTYSEWRSQLKPSVWDTAAIASIYGQEVDEELLEKVFHVIDFYDTESREAWSYRYEVSNYSLGYEWSAIERSGLGFYRPLDSDVNMYALKLFPTAQGDTLVFDINVATYQSPRVPELEAKFKDKRAEFKWRTLEYRNDFFGWYLDRSNDGGATWESLFDFPLINDNDTISGGGEALKYLYKTDLLPSNKVELMYRLQGADYLGGKSTNVSIVTGEGHDDISISPLLTNTIQTDSNYAVIQWEYDEKYNPMLQEFRIVMTDTTGQNYRIALDGIDPSEREAVVYMKFRSNFFRVQAVSKIGTVLTSFESLVMMYDVDPPAVPRDFDGYIDSLGAAHLSWVTSDELDLAGYYLFKSYFENGELAMITPDPLTGPSHIDSVNMITGNELVYYQLRSVDTRGNGSAFTPVLKLKKPDVYPPASPRIIEVKDNGKNISLRWGTSPSTDVESYRLYRRILEDDEDWSLLLSFHKDHFQNTFIDSLVELGKVYSYAMQVTDDDGLISEFSQPVSLKLKDYGIRMAISSFSGEPQLDERAIELKWTYSKSPREYYLYRSQGEEPMSLLKVIAGSRKSYKDEQLRVNETYKYVLRAVFLNGDVSPFTEELEIILE